MSQYLIESSHSPEDCLKALDQFHGKGPEILAGFEFGCSHGVHTGWAFRRADSEKQALEVVPTFIRSKARAVQVGKYTEGEIKKLHEPHK